MQRLSSTHHVFDTPSRSGHYERNQEHLSRSVTDLSPPSEKPRHHWHHRHHQHHHQQDQDQSGGHPKRPQHRRHRSHRHGPTHGGHDDRTVQPAGALQPGRYSLDVTRSEFVTPNLTPNISRRPSVLTPAHDTTGMATALDEPAAAAAAAGKLRNVDEELSKEKERASNRMTGLKKSLVDLSDFSTDATRRLDETYYSVLLKTSALQSTITALKELALASQEINPTFEKKSQEMIQDVQGQLGSLAHFDEHEQRIESLQNRIQAGRTKIEDLSGRVDVVKKRVEGWEKADRQWQERTRRRLRTMWTIMAVITAILAILFIGVRLVAQSPDNAHAMLSRTGGAASDVFAEGDAADLLPDLNDTPGLPLWRDRPTEVGEDKLRFLDEL